MGRRSVRTRQELVRIEFGESRDHLRQAAQHAAEGIGATVGPRYAAAKAKASSARGRMGPGPTKVGSAAQQSWSTTVAMLTPLADAAREGSARAVNLPSEKDIGRFGRMMRNGNGESHQQAGLIGLIAAGAALGAAGALVARRRNRARWAEYEPGDLQSDAASMVGVGEGGESHGAAAKLASWAKDNTRSAVGTVRGRMPRAGGKGKSMDELNERVADTPTDVTRELTGEAPGRPSDKPAQAMGESTTGRSAEGGEPPPAAGMPGAGM